MYLDNNSITVWHFYIQNYSAAIWGLNNLIVVDNLIAWQNN